ncbi:PREDICTED: uncharacterized protein LOC109464137 [Branchiostoma belcheri]|uniref:Uncharacterized protein LOC109464137 n=1 Tax=Branchiostoma belcheri TaxID=7741 RepID=A0A6P4Y2K0_BRABE|nr:PREDICTED: uncharacterized protein LOC109464137 [Branchiostoma belcheri]
MASMAQRPLAFCMFATNEDTVIADKLRCGGSVHELSRAVQTANVTRNRASALATVQTITGAIQLVELAVNTIGNLFGIFTGQDEPPPDDTPPRFLSCPHVPKLTIGHGETTARVNIRRPTYTDDRDEPGNCQLTESPSLNGMYLSAGSYEVTYTVSDSSGNACDGTCACKVSFEVVGMCVIFIILQQIYNI